MKRFPVPSSRTLAVAKVTLGLVVVGAVGWLLWQVLTLGSNSAATERELGDARVERGVLVESNQRQDAALEEANRRLRQADLQPVPTPSTPTIIEGETGPTGATGLTGPAGASIVGPRGPRGFTGPAGKAGEPGLPGPIGPSGEPGAKGQPGPSGPSGPSGTDGDNGAPGKDGTTGAQGPQGAPGEQGPRGAQGEPGAPGVPGEQGPAGAPGRDGTDGAPGAPGRGITAVSCDSLTPMSLTVTYSDGTTETYTCTPPALGRG